MAVVPDGNTNARSLRNMAWIKLVPTTTATRANNEHRAVVVGAPIAAGGGTHAGSPET